MNELIEKLKSLGMADADLLQIQEAYSKKLDEQVSLKVEEEKNKLVESNKKVIEDAVAAEKTKLQEGFDKQVKDLEADLLEKLDLFLESEVNEKIGPELLEQAGKYEAVAPILEGVQALFETHYVKLDSEGGVIVKKKEAELAEKAKELSEAIESKMNLTKELDSAKKKLLISEKTANLSENQTKRVNELFEDKDFAYTNSKIDSFISLMSEEKKKEEKKGDLNENKDAISKDDKPLNEKKEEKVESKPANYMKSILSEAGELV